MRSNFRPTLAQCRPGFALTICTTLLTLNRPALGADEITHDLLIRGANVIDGTGAPGVVTDVAISDGRISRMGASAGWRARRIVDATGLVLAPGFIDLHSHADRDIRSQRDAENCVRQGVTTLVVGNCGGSPTDATAFFRDLHEGGAGVNIVLLIGHGSVRVAEMGDRNVPPTAGQLTAMRHRVARMMEAGAVGLSTSLRYRPGAYAEMPEVVAVTREIAPYGGFYATHMRDEGVKIEEALEEALHIGREARVPVHISHHKISSASGWGLTQRTLATIDRVRAAGSDVTLDQYPYGAGSSSIGLMVPQPLIAGGTTAFKQRMADPKVLRDTVESVEVEILEKMFEKEQNTRDPKNVRVALARIQIARLAADTRLEGMNLAGILDQRKTLLSVRAGAELVVELVGRGANAIYHTIDDRPDGDVDRVMRHPQTCIASDGVLPAFGEGHPHPRSYGTYPRVLARYVRERRVLSWEEAICKMTGLPARRLGWSDRGLIQPGRRADLVLFDPGQINDTATFARPHAHAVGVSHVWIRGEAVLDGGKMTGNRPGRPIYSVPSANSPGAQLRHDVLELLNRLDVRFGVLAIAGDGREVFAFNADDRFFPGPASDGVAAKSPTLREAGLRGIAPARRDGVVTRTHGQGAGQVDLAVFSQTQARNGSALRVIAAYAGLREDKSESAQTVVQEELVKLLSDHLAQP
ncbi:MAG: D-aminoacylase [Verrucomicrobia bacterium]|nr:D-aminoacylase [Verrucomicrobiota bacterium]